MRTISRIKKKNGRDLPGIKKKVFKPVVLCCGGGIRGVGVDGVLRWWWLWLCTHCCCHRHCGGGGGRAPAAPWCPLPPSSPAAKGMVRLNEKEKRWWGLTYAAVTLLIIALLVVVVLGVGMGVGVTAEVVKMNEKKKEKKPGGGDSLLPSSSPYLSLCSLWSWAGMWALALTSAW